MPPRHQILAAAQRPHPRRGGHRLANLMACIQQHGLFRTVARRLHPAQETRPPRPLQGPLDPQFPGETAPAYAVAQHLPDRLHAVALQRVHPGGQERVGQAADGTDAPVHPYRHPLVHGVEERAGPPPVPVHPAGAHRTAHLAEHPVPWMGGVAMYLQNFRFYCNLEEHFWVWVKNNFGRGVLHPFPFSWFHRTPHDSSKPFLRTTDSIRKKPFLPQWFKS